MNAIRLIITLSLASLFVAGCSATGTPTESPVPNTTLAPTETAETVVEPTITEKPSPTASPTSAPPAIELTETYQPEDGGGSFSYPAGWEVIEDPGLWLVESGEEPPYEEADVFAMIQWHWLPDKMIDVNTMEDPLDLFEKWALFGEVYSLFDLDFANATHSTIGGYPATTILGQDEAGSHRIYLTVILAKEVETIAIFQGTSIPARWEKAQPIFDAVAGTIRITEPSYPLLIEDYTLDLTTQDLSPEPFVDEIFGFEIAYPEQWLVNERIDELGKNVIFIMDSGLGQCDWATAGYLSDDCHTPTEMAISVISSEILLPYFGWTDWSEVETDGVLVLMNIFIGNYFLNYVQINGFETFDLHGRPAFGAAYHGIDNTYTEGNPISGYLAVMYDDKRTVFIATTVPRAVWRDYWPVFRATLDSFDFRELPGGKFPNMEVLYREINAVAYSPDGQLLATLEELADLYVWDAETGELVFSEKGISNIRTSAGQVIFSPDGRFLAIQTGAVFVFEVATFELVQVLHEEMLNISSLAGLEVHEFDFSPDGEYIGVASEKGQAFIWDIETGEMQMELSDDSSSWVNHIAFSPDGELIATVTTEGPVRLWSATSGEEVHIIEDEALRGPLAFSPDSQELAISHGNTGIVSIWELEEFTKTKEIKVNTSDDSIWVNSLMYDATGEILLASTMYGPVVVRDLVTDQDLLRIDLEFLLKQAAISPDGSRFVTAGSDGSLLVWDTATGEVILAIEQLAAD